MSSKPVLHLYLNKPTQKDRARYKIIDTKTNKSSKFGSIDHENYTIHKNKDRKQRYMNRHKANY